MKHNNAQKHQKKIESKQPQKEKLPTNEVIEQLREQILEEARQVAKGTKVSIYEMIEMTKELIVLEEDAKASEAPKANGQATEAPSAADF